MNLPELGYAYGGEIFRNMAAERGITPDELVELLEQERRRSGSIKGIASMTQDIRNGAEEAKYWAEAKVSFGYSLVFATFIVTLGAVLIVLIAATHGAHFGS